MVASSVEVGEVAVVWQVLVDGGCVLLCVANNDKISCIDFFALNTPANCSFPSGAPPEDIASRCPKDPDDDMTCPNDPTRSFEGDSVRPGGDAEGSSALVY